VPAVPLVRVVRSGFEESVHFGSAVVADTEGALRSWAGDPQRVVFARSSMKPLQATVSAGLAGETLTDAELAVMCASHNGEPVHVEAVRALLERAGLGVDALRCPPDRPIDTESARTVSQPRPEYHNCSGKHAGMLLASVRQGWEVESYRHPGHPLQQSVLDAVRVGTGQEPQAIGVDGCGVPVHAVPLSAMATLYARLAGGTLPGSAAVTEAMRSEPYLVAGRDRVCTALMQAGSGLVAKVGAEGLLCVGSVDRGLGVAVRIEDGAARAADPAMIRVLALLGLADPHDERLRRFARPPVLGGGDPVGELVADFQLTSA
jgi:L-asparaginase II